MENRILSAKRNRTLRGLYDMHGQVWQWCEDYYGPSNSLSPQDPLRSKMSTYNRRILRGGSWNDNWIVSRSAYRHLATPESHHFLHGFRIALVLSDEAASVPSDDSKSEAALPPPPPPSAALEAMRRDQIAPEALKLAGDGDPNRAPASLVGVLGEVQPFHSQAVLGLAYSPDGRWLASGSVDKTIMLRDAATGQVKRILKGHTGAVSAVVFSKDSKSLVSASHDGTIKLWSVDKEEAPKTLRPESVRDPNDGGEPRWAFPGGWRSGPCDQALEMGTMGQAPGSSSSSRER